MPRYVQDPPPKEKAFIDMLAAYCGDCGAGRESLPQMLAQEMWGMLEPMMNEYAAQVATPNVNLMVKLSTHVAAHDIMMKDLEKTNLKLTMRILALEAHVRFLTSMHTDTHAYWSGQLQGAAVPYLCTYPKSKILQNGSSYAAKICERYVNFAPPNDLHCFICHKQGAWCAYRLKDPEAAREADTCFVHLCAEPKCMKTVRVKHGGVEPLQRFTPIEEHHPQWVSRLGTPWQLDDYPLSPRVFRAFG